MQSMHIPAKVREKLLFVIKCHLGKDLPWPQLVELVTINGAVNQNALQRLETFLVQREIDDVLEILRQTIAGARGYNNLEIKERQFLHILDQFFVDDATHATREWPAFCFCFTRNKNPFTEERSGLVISRPGIQNDESL